MTETNTASCARCGKSELPPEAVNATGTCFLCVAESFGFGERSAPRPQDLPPPDDAGGQPAPAATSAAPPPRAELLRAAERQTAHAARLKAQTDTLEKAKALGVSLGLAIIEGTVKAAPYLLESVEADHDLDQAARVIRDHGVQFLRLDRLPGL